MKNNFIKSKIIIALFFCFIIASSYNFAEGIVFNDDIQKVSLDYYYFDGMGNDKILRNPKENSWYILKPDGTMTKLNNNYIDYAGIESSSYTKYHDDYYMFVIRNKDNGTSFVYVDRNGIECKVNGYAFAWPTVSEKYYKVFNIRQDGSYNIGLYDKYNKVEVIPTIYNYFEVTKEGRITVCKNLKNGLFGKFGIINNNNELLIPFDYNFIQYINDNFIIAENSNDKYGVININNQVIMPFEYGEIWSIFINDAFCNVKKDNKQGLIDIDKAAITVPIEYDEVLYAMDGLVVAKKDGKFGIIDANNNVIAPFIYDFINNDENIFIAYKNDLIGFIDKNGKEILPCKFIDLYETGDNFITVGSYDENNEIKYAVYNFKGKELVPPMYRLIDYNATEKYMAVTKIWSENLIDKETGKEVLSNSQFSDIQYINDKYLAGGNGGLYSIVNFAGQTLTDQKYFSISSVSVNGEELLAAELATEERLPRKYDYFKQTKGPSSWAVKEVAKSIENNLVPDYMQAAFTKNIKRYEFCRMIVSYLEQKNKTTSEDIIKEYNIDVINPPIVDGINEDIAICLHFGIIKGRGYGIFDGDSEITREEAAIMLTNLAKGSGLITDIEDKYFNDKMDVSSWANDAVNFVLEHNIMQGTGNGMFSPKSKITREQAYIIMNRMLENKEAGKFIQLPKSDDTTAVAEEEFYALFNRAGKVWNWFYVTTMPLKGIPGPDGAIIIESKEYNEVDVPGIETLADLEIYLKQIFSDKIVSNLLKTGRYFDVDGKLCAIAADRGTNLYYGKIAKVKANMYSNLIEYVVSVEKLDDYMNVIGTEDFSFLYELEGDRWVFTKFPAWW